MRDLAVQTEATLVLSLIHRGLRLRDAELNEVAAELLTRLGPRAVRRLVLETVTKTNPPGYRLRALAVIERIGAWSRLDDFLDLHLLLSDRDARVRVAARRVLRM